MAQEPSSNRVTTPRQQALDAGSVSWNGQKPVLAAPIRLQAEGMLVSAIVLDDRG
ncbi:hypothetical protein [Vulcanococcus limneticus]|uniref:hypothetical protein n=1 Tax=Vulcanococcus limneticus TaxID=2170428 RepID=UPI00398BE9F5